MNSGNNIISVDVELVREFIDENFHKQITNEILAKKFHYHAYYLNRVFKEKNGIPLHSYIIEKRIENAKKRLANEDTPISVIAVECGFKATSYFSRLFKASTGISPSEFRNNKI